MVSESHLFLPCFGVRIFCIHSRMFLSVSGVAVLTAGAECLIAQCLLSTTEEICCHLGCVKSWSMSLVLHTDFSAHQPVGLLTSRLVISVLERERRSDVTWKSDLSPAVIETLQAFGSAMNQFYFTGMKQTPQKSEVIEWNPLLYS